MEFSLNMTKEIENRYLYGNKERLFLNTNLGCHAKCSYCYLPSLNISLGKIPTNIINIYDLIDKLNSNNEFVIGITGTILSLGCYSECWDIINREDTIKLINLLLKYGNPIQIATKEYINEEDFCKINLNEIKYENHLSIYISSSTITEYEKYEKGTISPKLRFNSFELQKQHNIPMYLYIKPVLNNITIKDVDKYIEIIKQYNISAIVGELFTKFGNTHAPIADGKLFYDNKMNDYSILVDKLSKNCNIFKYSTEPIKRKISWIK